MQHLTKNFCFKEFNDDGYSLETDKNGNPLYKREQVNGGFKYLVDSAIKGWNFLPPSWKQENLSAAEIVLNHLEHCENEGMSISRYLPAISVIIHNGGLQDKLLGNLELTLQKLDYLEHCQTTMLNILKAKQQNLKNLQCFLKIF